MHGEKPNNYSANGSRLAAPASLHASNGVAIRVARRERLRIPALQFASISSICRDV
jgi:hypothetical protein